MVVHEISFPRMDGSHYRLTSPPNSSYNCIAWAVGTNDEWWDPDEDYFWPADLPRDYDVATLTMLYEGIGYDLCDNADLEDGFEKVAIYGQNGIYEHVTRQLPDGLWTSKLGPDDDISHDTHDRLEGPNYGEVLHILKRSRKG